MHVLHICKVEGKRKVICLECGKLFEAGIQANAKFCCNRCGYYYRARTGISSRGRQIKLVCPVCGRAFYKNRSTALLSKYCSSKCRDRAKSITSTVYERTRRETLKEYRCRNCRKLFYKPFYRFSKFCSVECLKEYRKRRKKRFVCVNCGNDFYLNPCQVKARSKAGYKPKFCSRKCIEEYQSRRISKYCRTCGKKMVMTPFYEHRKHYCSAKCQGIGRRNGKLINCENCGKSIYITPALEKKNKRFCSTKCYSEYRIGRSKIGSKKNQD